MLSMVFIAAALGAPLKCDVYFLVLSVAPL